MADFDKFLPILLAHEGGYVNNPADPGGETNRGITMLTFKQCAKKLLSLDPTSENLKALTPEQAGVIYRTNYWNKIRCDEYPLQDLANIVCDFYVNAGNAAPRLLQRILMVDPDGAIGDATMLALKASDPVKTYNAYKTGRITYYHTLAEKYPMFIKGWMNRVNSFPDL